MVAVAAAITVEAATGAVEVAVEVAGAVAVTVPARINVAVAATVGITVAAAKAKHAHRKTDDVESIAGMVKGMVGLVRLRHARSMNNVLLLLLHLID